MGLNFLRVQPISLRVSSCNAMGAVHVLEDHAVKFEILKEEDKHHPIDWKKLGEPRNWVKLGFKLGNVRVVKTSRHIIIHPGKLRDFNADQLLVTAGEIVGRVRLELDGAFWYGS